VSRHLPRFRSAFLTSLVIGSALAGAVAAPVAAANNSILDAILGDCQFTGYQAGSKKTVKIEWRDADGALKSKHSVTSNSAGQFLTKCERYEEIESGDTVKSIIGGVSSPILTIPPLTAVIDRDADTITGVTTANKQIGVELITYDGAFVASNDYNSSAVSNNSGAYFFDASTADIMGYDDVYLFWGNARGDLVIRYAAAEAITVWIGRAVTSVVGNHGTDVDLELKDGVDVIGRSGGYLWEGRNGFYFYDDDGSRVRAAVGNDVNANFAPDADFTLPNITAVISKSADRVTADCGLGAGFGVAVDVYARDGTGFRSRVGITDGSGDFEANFAASPTHNIVAGDKVDVFCKLLSGDIVARRLTVS
jgi:hypothetical protein